MAPFINLALVGAANAPLEGYANAGDTPASAAFVKANAGTGSAQLTAGGVGARGVGVSSTAISEGNYVLTPVPPSADYFATVSLKILTTGNYFGIALRANTADRSRYSLDYAPDGSLIINKFPSSGNGVQITTGAGPTSFAWNPVAGNTVRSLKVQVEGTTQPRIRVWVDGGASPVIDVTDLGTPITAAGRVSLHWYNISAPTDTAGILATAVVADSAVALPTIGNISLSTTGATDTISYPAPTAGGLALSGVELLVGTMPGGEIATAPATLNLGTNATGGTFTHATATGGGSVYYRVRAYDTGNNYGYAPNEVASGPPVVTVPATAALVLRSPGNWAVAGSSLRSVNPGAYLKTLWTGLSTLSVGIDLSFNNPTYLPTVAWRWDGAPWSIATIQINLNLTPVALPLGTHLLEIVFDASYQFGQDRWGPVAGTTALSSSLTIAGFNPNSGAALGVTPRKARVVLIYGDSITAADRVNGLVAGGPAGGYGVETAEADVLKGYGYNLSIDAEVGIIGFGGSGLTTGGGGNVPSLPTSYSSIYAGIPRSFTDIYGDGTNKAPDAILYAEGTNDTGNGEAGPLSSHVSGICTGLKSVIGAIEAVAPLCKHGIMSPLNGAHEVSTQAVAVQLNDPTRVVWISTATWANQPGDLAGDGIHPLAVTHVGKIAPRVSDFAETVLNLGTTSALVGAGLISHALRRGR